MALNSASERGLLGIALHPDFPRRPWVCLYWTESTATDTTGAPIDTTALADTPLLGNRVDRFVWDGLTPAFDLNLIRLHAFQADAAQSLRGNHNGGVIRFERGHDDRGRHEGNENHHDGRGEEDEVHKAKLFIMIGDNGRRGQTQNLLHGPFGPGIPDDQFGGPQPDNAHLSGVILRLNDDGTTPATTRSLRPVRKWAAKPVPISRGFAPTVFATVSAWRWILTLAISGIRRTPTMRSAR